MLKFVKRPLRRRKSLLLTNSQPRVITQDYAVDGFGELPARKRKASAQARKLGHQLLGWHRRPNDPAGRWNAFCASCNRLVIVVTEPQPGLPDIYGKALTDDCTTPVT